MDISCWFSYFLRCQKIWMWASQACRNFFRYRMTIWSVMKMFSRQFSIKRTSFPGHTIFIGGPNLFCQKSSFQYLKKKNPLHEWENLTKKCYREWFLHCQPWINHCLALQATSSIPIHHSKPHSILNNKILSTSHGTKDKDNFLMLIFHLIEFRGALGLNQPELFESSENMKQTRLDIRMTRPTLPDSANPGF